MKIVFDKLQTSKETIQVSFDGGLIWNSYIVSEIINDGIPLDENQEYDKIQIKGSSTVLKNLDVVRSIEIPESNNTKDEMFTHNGTRFFDDLVNVKIPEGFTSTGNHTFYSCTNLTNVDIPDSITFIGASSFEDCISLTSISLSKNLASIGDNAFNNCISLTSIAIPGSVTFIGYNAFRNCRGLKTINFKGTEDQWNAITKDSNWNSDCPSDMVINFDYQGE